MKIRFYIMCLVLLAGIGGLFGCSVSATDSGDGGGGVIIPAGYDGATTPAVLTPANAETLTDNVVSFDNPASYIVFRNAGGETSGRENLRGLAKVSSLARDVRSLVRTAGATKIIPGEFSGSAFVTYTETYTTYNATVEFTNFSDSADAPPLYGTVYVSETWSVSGSTTKGTVNATFADNFWAGPVKVTGSFRLAYTESASYVKDMVTMNLLYEDTSLGYSLAYSNLVFTDDTDYVNELATQSLNGRIYDSDYGYVVIDTAEPVVMDTVTGFYYDGEIFIDGTSGSSVWLLFTGNDIIARLEAGDDNLFDDLPPWYAN
ncbi:hypothetical protein EPN96_03730 [bacterium]|nr:MAG: hypothetical protein EPN96_03730 [bacterium]